MSPPQKGKATAAPAASWPSASASWPSWQLLWQLPHPPLPSAAVKLSLLRPLSCQPSQNPTQRATRLTTSHEWLLSCSWWQISTHRVCSPAQLGHINPTPESCYLKDWVGDLCVLASPDVSLRPRQQTPLCMTTQLSSTLLYSDAASMVMVPKLSVALTANYPAIEILQQGPAPSGTSSYHTPSRQQQRNAHNTAYTKLLETLQH